MQRLASLHPMSGNPRVMLAKDKLDELKAGLQAQVSTIGLHPQDAQAYRDFLKVVDAGNLIHIMLQYLRLVAAWESRIGFQGYFLARELAQVLQAADHAKSKSSTVSERPEPEAWLERCATNAASLKQVQGLAQELPGRLSALVLELKQLESYRVMDVPGALLGLVRSLRGAKDKDGKPVQVPAEVEALAGLVMRGRAVLAVMPMQPPHVALQYPITAGDFPEHLTSDEAVRYLATLNCVISKRKLQDRAKDHPELKAGSQYVREALSRAHRVGVFAHGNET
jgi:hypothetical protein